MENSKIKKIENSQNKYLKYKINQIKWKMKKI